MAVVLPVEERKIRPRSLRKKLRGEGKIPGVVYGNGVKSRAISVDSQLLSKAIREHGQNAVYTLVINGGQIQTLIYTQQQDTFNRQWIHVEFLAVNMTEVTELEADIVLIGVPIGVKNGGEVAQSLYSVVVSATPDQLPETVEIDITNLSIGEALTLSDIEPEGYTIIGDPGEQIVGIVKPRV